MSKRKNLLTGLLAAMLLLTGIALAASIYINHTDTSSEPSGLKNSSQNPDRMNILLLGSDARPNQKVGNTDTIIVAQIDGERVELLSIPRDTRVEIPGYGLNKINAACRYGGPELTARVVSDLIGLKVEKYALVRWEGFINIVDTLGGVDVDVPRNMYYDPQEGSQYRISLHKGKQHLNGQQALAFVRFRHEALGDIDRTGQQLAFMKAVAEQVKQPSTLLKLPWLIPEFYKNVDTNLSLGEGLIWAKMGTRLQNIQVVTQTLPGYFLNLDGISYWGVDPDQARQVAYDLFTYGTTTRKVVLDTPPGLSGSSPTDKVQVAQQTGPENSEGSGETEKPNSSQTTDNGMVLPQTDSTNGTSAGSNLNNPEQPSTSGNQGSDSSSTSGQNQVIEIDVGT